MSDSSLWQQNNDAYLAAALGWLRLRLIRQVGALGAVDVGTPQTRPEDAVTDAQLTQAAETMAAATAVKPPPALMILSKRLDLSRFEGEVLLLCAAMELDTRVAAWCARAQDDPHRPYPTFALALSLFDDPAWEALSPERPLRYWRLIEINQPGAQPLTTSALRADERIVNYLKGLNQLDDRLAALLVPLGADDMALPPSQQAAVETVTRSLQQARQHVPVIHLIGGDVPSKQLIAARAAAEMGLFLYRLPAELLPAQAAELETLARLWQRESLLLPLALYLDAHEIEKAAAPEGPAALVNRFLTRCQGVVFLDTRDVWYELSQTALVLDVAKPTPAEQQATWAAALGDAAGDSPAQLAGQFNLGLAAIQRIAHSTLSQSINGEVRERLWDACLAGTRPRLDALARHLDPRATWNDLVLPEPELKLLHQIVAQVRQRSKVYDEWGFRGKMNRGLGISALFAGESGTGKTMAAEVVANDLRLNLYRIDLSAVVSKYIGETEKNLRRLFDAAEDGGAILFFDEADALFGKRSEVKDSHDRYANIEINYLLQRMEAYRGLAILATNMKSALDTAFMRRLRFVINFPFPGPAERRGIWQIVFPPQTQTQGLDFDRLSRLAVSGGSIHNIALAAAFLAAQAGTPVTMPLVLEAARTEFRKLERPINEADFHWQEPARGAA